MISLKTVETYFLIQ